jgi:Ca2+-binding EF-hand superfamily protein
LIPAEEPDATKQADQRIQLELGRDHVQVLTIQPVARPATASVPRWLAWDGLRLTLRWPNPADTSNNDAQAALNEFLDAVCPADPGFRRSEDVDFNRDPYLAEIFERADRNADRVLTRDELRDYQLSQMELMRLGAVVRMAWESASLWDWLDQNRDGRLSLRELNHAAAESLPREGPKAEALDTTLRSYELILEWTPGDLRLVEQLRELHQPGAAAGSGGGSLGTAGSPQRRRGEGPIWFDAMDRNQDGDLTPREFLGTPAQFQELDTNQDGLISRAEARAAKRPAPTAETRP